jgi:hypothetical protein
MKQIPLPKMVAQRSLLYRNYTGIKNRSRYRKWKGYNKAINRKINATYTCKSGAPSLGHFVNSHQCYIGHIEQFMT